MKFRDTYRFLSPKHQNLFLEYRTEFRPRYGHGLPAHPLLYDIINARRDEYAAYLGKSLLYSSAIQEIKKSNAESDPLAPSWNNEYLPGLDIIGIYTLLSEFRPARYVEIGSGNSTKVAFKAKKDRQLNTEIVSIDPLPRAEIDQLSDKVIREPFENIDFSFIHELEENDILFIDNSHRMLPNSDSMVIFMEVLPYLKNGVIVQIHDVYLPYDYPQFMCDRFYSEQYGLAIYLMADPSRYQPILPNYFISEDTALSKQIEALWDHPNLQGVERHGGSFWLRINRSST
jgi:hypothetical protein